MSNQLLNMGKFELKFTKNKYHLSKSISVKRTRMKQNPSPSTRDSSEYMVHFE